ncbi:MAG: hypothetical protein IT518_09040 [Burkholderiales bacterium]|nr:hypothetical protein [Burkholderiales bacterium]
MSRGLPVAVRDQILDLVSQGRNQGDVAIELGVTPGQVAGLVFRARIAAGHVARPRGQRNKPLPRLKFVKPLPPAPIAATHPSGDAGSPSTPSAVLHVAAGIMRQETARARTPILATSIAPARTCQWIDGEPSADDACKCGQPTMLGFSYCEPHLARAYQPRKVRADGATPATIEEWNRLRVDRLNAAIGREAT